jgi:3-hydroxyacyl-CoA dehydrogenase
LTGPRGHFPTLTGFELPSSRLAVRRVAVLGAGVMGAQIAAQFVNAGVPAILFDLPSADGNRSSLAQRAIDNLLKLEPAPLAVAGLATRIAPANYRDDAGRLADCDLVIEAIGERIDWKRDLYAKIGPHIAPSAVIASNTSGLSLAALADALPQSLRSRFCGVHFFNPPRYMHLVELIPTAQTDRSLVDALETLLTSALGKGVVRARDTPNFIANRIGIFSVLATMHHARTSGLGFDVVDALTGPTIGRAKSATYRTADIVGLDTMAHVIDTMRTALPGDPWHPLFAVPSTMAALIERRALGRKTGAGYYRKVGHAIDVFDPATDGYVRSAGTVSAAVAAITGLPSARERLAALRESSDAHARLLWAIHRDLFHYAAYHVETIADSVRDVDLAIRWGFGWRQGPFELWQQAGWRDVAGWIADDIAAGRALARVALPAWVTGGAAGSTGVYGTDGAFSPSRDAFSPRSPLPVYRRQLFPDALPGERFDTGTTAFETDAVRCWHLRDDVGIVSFTTKQNTISEAVLDGVLRAIEHAEREWAALVLWNPREPFSLGADLGALAPAIERRAWDGIEAIVAKFQHVSQRLRYSQVPTVAAVRGMALGGACEFIMHCDRTVAALESYPGLVETGVGLLPAGGGSKELTLRAAADARRGVIGGQLDCFPFLRTYFQNVAMARVSNSAVDARDLGYLRESDPVVMHPHEVLHVAIGTAGAMADAGYRPPFPARAIAVAGRTGIATLTMLLVNLREGRFISDYDCEVGVRLARVMCGGDVDAGSVVDERWLLDLERREFMALLQDGRTQARIAHTLKTGKPLRN